MLSLISMDEWYLFSEVDMIYNYFKPQLVFFLWKKNKSFLATLLKNVFGNLHEYSFTFAAHTRILLLIQKGS